MAQSTQIQKDPQSGKDLWVCRTTDIRDGSGAWLGSSDLCIPNFLEVAGWFKGVQRAVNAWRRKKNKPPIAVDAKIGPETRMAVNEIIMAERLPGHQTFDWCYTPTPPDTTSSMPEPMRKALCPFASSTIAAQAVQIATQIAQKVGAQPDFDPQPKSTPQEIPTTVPPETLENIRDQEKKKSSLKWWIVGGVVAALAAGGAYYWYRKRQGRPLFGSAAPMDAEELDGEDYDDEPPPEFGNVIDV